MNKKFLLKNYEMIEFEMIDFIGSSKEDILIMSDDSTDFVGEVRTKELDFKFRKFVKLE